MRNRGRRTGKQEVLIRRYSDVKGKWVLGEYLEEGEAIEEVVIGSLQPYRKGKFSIDLPDGSLTSDVKILITEDEIHTVDEFDQHRADVAIIDGFEWYAKRKHSYRGFNSLNHDEVMFIRQDRDTRRHPL